LKKPGISSLLFIVEVNHVTRFRVHLQPKFYYAYEIVSVRLLNRKQTENLQNLSTLEKTVATVENCPRKPF